MSEPAAAPTRPEPESYTQAWATALGQVLGEITGSPFAASVSSEAPADLPASAAADLWIVVACAGALRGEMSIRIAPAFVVRLAQLFMSEPAAPAAEMTAEHREAAVELLRQVGGVVATSIGSVWGEVQIRLEASPAAPSWAAASTAWLRLGDDSSPLWIEILLSAALMAALRAERPEPVPAAAPSAAATLPPSPAPAPNPPATSVPANGAVNLDLLMDVELAVTLRFGSRRLLLREILDLNAGAVINLDRQVPEPVDMLLDGRVVARGEIVVIDGTYGLRVTEVGPVGIS
ncbi:MAG: flagellar motor switch protein FliN [Candidatus Sulfotelmatobacter sp.]